MMTETGFKERACPYCGLTDRTRVFELPAERFCASNWTYAKNFAEILGVAPSKCYAIARCLGCGFLYAEREPSLEFLARLYDEVIRHHDNLAANENPPGYARRLHYVADLIQLASPGECCKALDFGCGLGNTLRLLEGVGVRALGFDTSAKRRQYVGNSNQFVTSSYDDVRSNGPYGVIVCDNVLEHIPSPGDVIAFLASVAKQGAVLFASVPDYNRRFVESQKHAFEEGGPLDMSLNPWEHLNYFDLQHLDGMLAQAGFAAIPEALLPGTVNIGLRRELSARRRILNACASGVRLARYLVSGSAIRSPNCAFYRCTG